RAPAHDARRRDERRRDEDDHGVVHGQALCRRGGGEGGERVRADPRRLWVHQGLSGGKVLSRREAVHDWRGDKRNPAAGDCTAIVEGLMVEERRTEQRSLIWEQRILDLFW